MIMFDFFININFFLILGNELADGNYYYITPFALLILLGTIFEIRKMIKKKKNK